jgi:hypothetical protein
MQALLEFDACISIAWRGKDASIISQLVLAIMLDAKQKSPDTRGMNKLPLAKRAQILSMLCEGSSMRSVSRVADVSINSVSKLLVEAGEACAASMTSMCGT